MIIGLCGYARAGKDTAADALVEARGFRKVAFADSLKRDVTMMLNAAGICVDFENPEQKEEWRDLLVFWGRKMRQKDPDYWIKRLIFECKKKHIGLDEAVVIPDVRYLNEANWVTGHGGSIFMVDRPGVGPANEEEQMSIEQIDGTGRFLRIFNDSGVLEFKTMVSDLVARGGWRVIE